MINASASPVHAMSRKFAKLFAHIDRLLQERETVVLAIDGMCCAGKTTLAKQLSHYYDCNVFHMDDFFLPPELKTRERLFAAGGNIHYERFEEQVMQGLRSCGDFTYQKYDCKTQQLSAPIQVAKKRLNIIEGVYCMRLEWAQEYDFRIFLCTTEARQKSCVQKRCGTSPVKDRFLNEWIPMENRYFEAFRVRSGCDLIYFN